MRRGPYQQETDPRWEQCRYCGHYRGEHSPAGCTCQVLGFTLQMRPCRCRVYVEAMA